MSWIRDNVLSWFQRLAIRILKTGHIPKHVAFIMDGNRRYASKTRIKHIEGHTIGYVLIKEILYIHVAFVFYFVNVVTYFMHFILNLY